MTDTTTMANSPDGSALVAIHGPGARRTGIFITGPAALKASGGKQYSIDVVAAGQSNESAIVLTDAVGYLGIPWPDIRDALDASAALGGLALEDTDEAAVDLRNALNVVELTWETDIHWDSFEDADDMARATRAQARWICDSGYKPPDMRAD